MGTMREILDLARAQALLSEAADDKCRSKYVDPKTGRFKGGTGERFQNCVEYMKCKGGVDDPEAVCAKIARAKGLAHGQREALGEAVSAAGIQRIADAMLTAPQVERMVVRALGDEEVPPQMFYGMIREPLEALVAQALDAVGVTVAGGTVSRSARELKGVARGSMGA